MSLQQNPTSYKVIKGIMHGGETVKSVTCVGNGARHEEGFLMTVPPQGGFFVRK